MVKRSRVTKSLNIVKYMFEVNEKGVRWPPMQRTHFPFKQMIPL